MVQLDRTCVRHGLDMTHFSFYACASMHLHTRLMMSSLSFKALVYALNVYTAVCRRTCACQEHACQIFGLFAQIVSQGQQNNFNSCLRQLYVCNKMAYFSYKDGCGTHGCMYVPYVVKYWRGKILANSCLAKFWR